MALVIGGPPEAKAFSRNYSGLSGSYGYDAVGTITTNIEFGSPTVYSYGGPNAAHGIPKPPDGLTDAQRWGQLGGRPPNN